MSENKINFGNLKLSNHPKWLQDSKVSFLSFNLLSSPMKIFFLPFNVQSNILSKFVSPMWMEKHVSFFENQEKRKEQNPLDVLSSTDAII